jgi:hypothetical protein
MGMGMGMGIGMSGEMGYEEGRDMR